MVYHLRYKPNWRLYFTLAVLVHFILILLLMLTIRENFLEVRQKKINIKIIPPKGEEKVVEVKNFEITKPQLPQKSIKREEVDKLIYEIYAPKITTPNFRETYEEKQEDVKESFKPTLEITRDTSKSGGKTDVGAKSLPQVKGSKGSSENLEGLEITSQVKEEKLSSLKGVKTTKDDFIGGNIKWKGTPREVIEWYTPEIPPDMVKTKRTLIVRIHISPAGFVSRIEVVSSSGDTEIDSIITRTLRKVRFNTSSSTTIADVELSIITK